MRTDSRVFQEPRQLRVDVRGVYRREPDAGRCGSRQQTEDQRSKATPVGTKVDPGQHDLAVSGACGRAGAALQIWRDAGDGVTAGLPDDAEGAAVVAAILHLQHVSRSADAGRVDLGLD